MRYYFLSKEIDAPLAFSRVVLNVIFKKNEELNPANNTLPLNNFVADKTTILEQEAHLETLQTNLAACEQQLNEILHSKRWQLANVLALPYRRFKTLFHG